MYDYLRPIVDLDIMSIYNESNLWCITQTIFMYGLKQTYLFVDASTKRGFNTRQEVMSILTKYGVSNTRSNAVEVRVGVFRIAEAYSLHPNCYVTGIL